jgi:hypothetical protein
MKYPVLLSLLLTACGGGVVVDDRPTIVKVPVTVPCLSGELPMSAASLKSKYPDWDTYSVKQKAELVAAQALRYKSYSEELNAATGACQ